MQNRQKIRTVNKRALGKMHEVVFFPMKSSSEMMHVRRKYESLQTADLHFYLTTFGKGWKKAKKNSQQVLSIPHIPVRRTTKCLCCQTKSSTALPGLHQPCPITPLLPAARPTSTLGCVQPSSGQFFVGDARQVTVCYKFWCNLNSCFFHRMEASILPGSGQISIKFSVLNK